MARLERGQGIRTDLTLPNVGQSEYAQVLEDTGTTRQDASRWQVIASRADDEIKAKRCRGWKMGEMPTRNYE